MSPVVSRHAAGSLARRECGSARGAAVNTWNRNGLRRVGFPRHRAAASLKHDRAAPCDHAAGVFRGIGPRPH